MTTPRGAPVALRGVDRAAFAVAFVRRLRAAGVAVGLSGVEAFTRALEALPPVSRSGLYFTARTTLVRRQEDHDAFDTVFATLFGEAGIPLERSGRPRARPAAPGERTTTGGEGAAETAEAPLPWATLPAPVASTPGQPEGRSLPEWQPSRAAGLENTPFEDLDDEDLAMLGARLSEALRNWPTRRSRHRVRGRSGDRVDVRASIRRARRTAFEPVRPVLSRRRRAPRRIVLLCDVSRSMQPYATAYLHLLRVAVLGADAEVFAFATGCTRLSPVLAHRSPAIAVERASAAVTDRFGGTRIASSIRSFLASRHGQLARGAVVVVASDGWDADPPNELATAMSRLQRRAHRVVWLNPRAGAPGFAPRAGGMAAALPYCDALLAADTATRLGAAFASIAEAAYA